MCRTKTANLLLALSVCLLFLSALPGVLAMPGSWKTQEADHFVLYYQNAAPEEVSRILEKAQQHFGEITHFLGLAPEGLWTRDKRVKIYLYDSRKQYLANTGQPQWSDSSSIQAVRVVYSFVGAHDFAESALPHEIGHIIFKELIGFASLAVPVWLEEGVAAFGEGRDTTKARDIVRDALARGTLVSVPELDKLIMRNTDDTSSIDLFFAESKSIVEYLITQFGADKFRQFLHRLKESQDLEKSLERTFGFPDTARLDKAWQAYLKK